MAYVKVSTTKNAVAALRYGEHEKGVVRGGVDCPEDTEIAIKLFAADRMMWNKDSGLQAHIVIQSFQGRECSPEEANKIGQELAQKVAPGHRAMVYTHQQSEGGNIHNHIVICSVNQNDGYKLDTRGMLWKCRIASNELTNALGLSDITERVAGLRYTQAEKGLIEKGERSWKDDIREVVDNAKQKCKSEVEFKTYLAERGITINERNSRKEDGGKSWTYYSKDGRVRGSKLGNDYTRSSVIDALSQRQAEHFKKRDTSVLDKALDLVNQHAEQARKVAEQEKILTQATKILSNDKVMKRAMTGRVEKQDTSALQARISLLLQALDILDSGSRVWSDDSVARMMANESKAEIEHAISILKSAVSSAEAKAEAAKVFQRW